MGTRRNVRRKVRRLFAASDSPRVRALLVAMALLSVIGAWEVIATGLWQNEFETEVEREVRNDLAGKYSSPDEARQAVRQRGNPYSVFR